MATWIWVNIGLGNGLLPDGTRPPLSKVFCGIHRRAISQEVFMNVICTMVSYITLYKFLPPTQGPMRLCNMAKRAIVVRTYLSSSTEHYPNIVGVLYELPLLIRILAKIPALWSCDDTISQGGGKLRQGTWIGLGLVMVSFQWAINYLNPTFEPALVRVMIQCQTGTESHYLNRRWSGLYVLYWASVR